MRIGLGFVKKTKRKEMTSGKLWVSESRSLVLQMVDRSCMAVVFLINFIN
jgi:hypothetical protein